MTASARAVERFLAAGRRALANRDFDGAVAQLDEALALWRGVPLTDVDGGTLASTERARLEEEHLGAMEARTDALLASGRHQETIGELETLTAAHPLRERFWHQRLMALYRGADLLGVGRGKQDRHWGPFRVSEHERPLR